MTSTIAAVPETTTPGAPGAELDPRTRRLLYAPIVPLLLTLAWPNVVVMLAQASTGLIETFWVSRLGTDALAGMALVFPGVMLMQMISAGSLGGGISSAIARALGARRPADADALVVLLDIASTTTEEAGRVAQMAERTEGGAWTKAIHQTVQKLRDRSDLAVKALAHPGS